MERLVAWAGNAAAADPLCEHLTRVWRTLYEDWHAKTRQIGRLEQDLAGILVKTPYLLLLSHPGINVVSASELAGEMGPIEKLRLQIPTRTCSTQAADNAVVPMGSAT